MKKAPFYRKILVPLLVMSLIVGGLYFPKSVEAQTQSLTTKCLSGALSGVMGDILGGFLPSVPGINQQVPTNDKRAQSATRAFQFDECITAVTNAALKLALQNLKTKLLDQMVDQTIGWIRDEREPKYVTNFKSILDDVLASATSDALREINLAKLYPDENLAAGIEQAIKSRLNTKRFSESISFDNDAVDTEEFKTDFRKGGFAGFQKASLPNNNPEGAAFFAGLYADSIIDQKIATENSITSNLARSVVECKRWVLVYTDASAPDGNGNFYLDANKKRKIIETEFSQPAHNPPKSSIAGTKYICQEDGTGSGQYIKTPSSIVEETAKTVVTQDVDYLIGADDIESYILRIADSAFNRLLKEGLDAFNRDTPRGQNIAERNEEYINEDLQKEVDDYIGLREGEKVRGEVNDEVRADLIARSRELIAIASSGLSGSNTALAQITSLAPMLNSTSSPEGLAVCMEYKPAFNPAFTSPDPQPTWWPVGNRPTLIAKLKALANLLRNLTNTQKQIFTEGLEDATDYLTRSEAINANTPTRTISTLQNQIKDLSTDLTEKKTEANTHNANVQSIFTQTARERTNCNGNILNN
jgi:hypothetical protein